MSGPASEGSTLTAGGEAHDAAGGIRVGEEVLAQRPARLQVVRVEQGPDRRRREQLAGHVCQPGQVPAQRPCQWLAPCHRYR